MQIQNCTLGSPIESVDKALQECETKVLTPIEQKEHHGNDDNTVELSSESPAIRTFHEWLQRLKTLSDLSESDEDVEVPELSQPPSNQPMIAPQLVLFFLYETYRQWNVVIKDKFPDRVSFIQTAKDIMRKADEFSLIKSQFHHLGKFMTRAGLEIRNTQPNPLIEENHLWYLKY